MDEDAIKKMYIEDVKSELVMWAIVKAEGITVSEEEIEEGFLDMYEEYNYDSVEDMKADYTTYEIEHALIEQKVIQFVIDNAIITEVPYVEETDEE